MRRPLAIAILVIGVFVLAPVVWIGTVAVTTTAAWALWEAGIKVVSGGVAVPIGGLCGMVTAFLTAVGAGLVARWLWMSEADA